MTNEELIIEVLKRKYLIIIVTVLIFILAFTFQYRALQSFRSSATFIVNETDVNDLNGPSQFIGDLINTSEASVNRLLKFAYSTEMMNHLIKRFNLYTYYQIDTTSAFAYEKIIAILSNRMSLIKLDPKIIQITVSDKDRYQAAAIANESAMMLNVLNENYLKKQLGRRVALYEGIYESVKNELDQHEDKMIQILENYKSILNSLEKSKVDVSNLKYSLSDLNISLKSKRDELIKMRQVSSVMMETLKNEHLETITIINTALPDYHSNTKSILIISIIIALVSTCAMILLVHVYLTNQKYIQLIFRKK